jgi:hypothetical protein
MTDVGNNTVSSSNSLLHNQGCKKINENDSNRNIYNYPDSSATNSLDIADGLKERMKKCRQKIILLFKDLVFGG